MYRYLTIPNPSLNLRGACFKRQPTYGEVGLRLRYFLRSELNSCGVIRISLRICLINGLLKSSPG